MLFQFFSKKVVVVFEYGYAKLLFTLEIVIKRTFGYAYLFQYAFQYWH